MVGCVLGRERGWRDGCVDGCSDGCDDGCDKGCDDGCELGITSYTTLRIEFVFVSAMKTLPHGSTATPKGPLSTAFVAG